MIPELCPAFRGYASADFLATYALIEHPFTLFGGLDEGVDFFNRLGIRHCAADVREDVGGAIPERAKSTGSFKARMPS